MDATEFATKRELLQLKLEAQAKYAPREQVEELEDSVHGAEIMLASIQKELAGIHKTIDKLEATINKFLWALLLPLLGGLVALVLQVSQ